MFGPLAATGHDVIYAINWDLKYQYAKLHVVLEDWARDECSRGIERGLIGLKVDEVNRARRRRLVCEAKCLGDIGMAVGPRHQTGGKVRFLKDRVDDVAILAVHQKYVVIVEFFQKAAKNRVISRMCVSVIAEVCAAAHQQVLFARDMRIVDDIVLLKLQTGSLSRHQG